MLGELFLYELDELAAGHCVQLDALTPEKLDLRCRSAVTAQCGGVLRDSLASTGCGD
jgi:hypothetical protein